MFQPGEEGQDGAGAMIAEGVLDAAGRRADAAYGLHVFANMLPRGVFATRPGPLMAASSGLYVTVRGAGGHGSRPHAAADPIVVAAEMVTALQTMVTRQFDLFDPVVVTVGSFQAGTRRNIIPETATFEAPCGPFSPSLARGPGACSRAAVRADRRRARAAGRGRVHREYPVTVNDPDQADFALTVAADLFGPDRALPAGGPGDGLGGLLPGAGRGARLRSSSSAPAPATTRSTHPATTPRSPGSTSRARRRARLLAELARRRLDQISSP